MSSPVARVGGRVLLLDADDRLLLIHERIEDGSTHWLTPGGGVEDGESPAEAAVREAYEEVGLRLQLESPRAVLVTQRLWGWDGIVYDQTDHFFVARADAAVHLEPRGLTAMERETLLGHRWWTLDELRSTNEVLVPAEVADIVELVSRAPARDR